MPLLFAYGIRHVFAWPGPKWYVLTSKLVRIKSEKEREQISYFRILSHFWCVIFECLPSTKIVAICFGIASLPGLYLELEWSSTKMWIFICFSYKVRLEDFTKHMSRDMTKPTKWVCAQRRLKSVWASAQSDQSSLSVWRNLGSLATHWAHSEDSGQTGRMPRLIWVFAGRTATLLVLSSRGSYTEWARH